MEVPMTETPLRLPERPSLDQLRKQAKELQVLEGLPTLAAAQHTLARRYGYASWPKLKVAVESQILRRYIETRDAQAAHQMLVASPKLAALPFADGSTPLHVASERNSVEIIADLVRAGARFEEKYAHSGHTALSWAITVGSFKAANKLVELGDEPDLFCAAGLGMLEKVQSFWNGDEVRPSPSKTGSSRWSDDGKTRLPCPPERDEDQISDALYIASRAGRLDVARWLLDHGADPNWRGFQEASCLAWAEFSGNPELCALLRERGASDEMRDAEFRATPKVFGLMILVAWGFWPERLRAMLSGDPSLANSRGEIGTLLNAAAYNGQLESAKILLEFGADKTIRNVKGLTPKELALAQGHKDLAQLLAE